MMGIPVRMGCAIDRHKVPVTYPYTAKDTIRHNAFEDHLISAIANSISAIGFLRDSSGFVSK